MFSKREMCVSYYFLFILLLFFYSYISKSPFSLLARVSNPCCILNFIKPFFEHITLSFKIDFKLVIAGKNIYISV